MDHRAVALHARARRPLPRGIPDPVVIVGAGICGAATADALHHAGTEVLLLDRGDISGGTTGLGEGNVLMADAPHGHAAWHALAERFPDAVRLRQKGSLTVFNPQASSRVPGTPEASGEGSTVPGTLEAGTLEAWEELVEDPRSVEPLLRPGLPPAIFVADDLQVDPRATARALAAGVPARTGAAVVRVEAGGVELADGERIRAAAVVIAAGPWSAALAPELDVRPRRGQLIALGPAAGRAISIRHKVIAADYPAPLASVIEEALSGEIYVGSTRDDVGFDDAAPHAQALHTEAARWMPALADLPVTRTWVGFRPYRPGGPFVGRLDSGVWAITGHEGAGIGAGPADARRLAQELLAAPAS